jgi:hypothetical protein
MPDPAARAAANHGATIAATLAVLAKAAPLDPDVSLRSFEQVKAEAAR